MRIAVGFKVTPDYETLRASAWTRAAKDGVDTRYVRRVLDAFDEGALELALRVRDARAAQALETDLAAFSLAGREADPFLKTLQALGYGLAARLRPDPTAAGGPGAAKGAGPPGSPEASGDDTTAALDFAPAATATLIAAFAQELGGDLLLLASRSLPGDDATIPFFVAETLKRPCLTEVTDVEPAGEDSLRVTFAADDGLVRATVRTPCVLAVGNALVSHLRVPTLADRLAVRDAVVTEVPAAKLGVDVPAMLRREPTVLSGLTPVDRRRAGVVVGGGAPSEKASRLYHAHLRSELEKL